MVNALGIRNALALGLTLRNLGSYQHHDHTQYRHNPEEKRKGRKKKIQMLNARRGGIGVSPSGT